MASVRISGGVAHDLPADLRVALASDAKALAAWQDITPLARNEWICWTLSVKKHETSSELKEGMGGRAAGQAVRIDEFYAAGLLKFIAADRFRRLWHHYARHSAEDGAICVRAVV